MKYLIFFLSFFITTGVSAQLEFDTTSYIGIGSISTTPQVYYGGMTDIEMPGFTTTPMPFIVEDRVHVIEADTTYISIQGICEIEDNGKIRYGLIIEAVDGAASVQYVLLLPDSGNNTWEKLKNNQ